MTFQNLLSKMWILLLGFILFLTAVICRPLIPIDETRYMSVAWEMWLHNGWFDPLTKNFEPYHHKPPLLFWLINAFWSLFGVSRWAGTLPVVIASCLCIYLTGILGKTLAKDNPSSPLLNPQRTSLIMAASLPFFIYGTLVMFDFLLCMFVLISLILIVRYSYKRHPLDLILLGLCLGLGVLTKGPVAYLYILPIFLLAPFWNKDLKNLKSWYASCLGAILVSAIPVLFWLIPMTKASDNDFAFWLVWNQTAGRVTGNFGDAHVRPIYFYLPFLPLFLMPWILFPAVWKFLPTLKSKLPTDTGLRFILCWFVPVFIAFCLISGKQVHYMVPLVPAMALFFAYALHTLKQKTLIITLIAIVSFITLSQIVAKHTLLEKYDLMPIADYIHNNSDKKIAFVTNYHAEFSFLARLTKPIEDVKEEHLKSWFQKNPDGIAIVKYRKFSDLDGYHVKFDMKYRGRNKAVIALYH
jgi:4-amino-4-deoxy-L-arabinose transferase-like glycosyltransferase